MQPATVISFHQGTQTFEFDEIYDIIHMRYCHQNSNPRIMCNVGTETETEPEVDTKHLFNNIWPFPNINCQHQSYEALKATLPHQFQSVAMHSSGWRSIDSKLLFPHVVASGLKTGSQMESGINQIFYPSIYC